MDSEGTRQLVDEMHAATGQAAVAFMDATDEQLVEHLEHFVRAVLQLRSHLESHDLPWAQIRGFVVGCVMSVLDD